MTAVAVVTNGDVMDRHQIDTGGIEHLDEHVPFLTGPQRQGDVLLIPVKAENSTPGERVPAKGVTVVRGETTGGNSHILHTLDGECFWEPAANADTQLVQGRVTVPADSTATLLHTQEHNVIGIGPGSYELRRQQEFAGEWRRVSD